MELAHALFQTNKLFDSLQTNDAFSPQDIEAILLDKQRLEAEIEALRHIEVPEDVYDASRLALLFNARALALTRDSAITELTKPLFAYFTQRQAQLYLEADNAIQACGSRYFD